MPRSLQVSTQRLLRAKARPYLEDDQVLWTDPGSSRLAGYCPHPFLSPTWSGVVTRRATWVPVLSAAGGWPAGVSWGVQDGDV